MTALCRDWLNFGWDEVKTVCQTGLICPYAPYNNITILFQFQSPAPHWAPKM